jgi:hypothetical protein
MSGSPNWDDLLSHVLNEPSLAPFARDGAVIIWDENGRHVLYANEAGALLVGFDPVPASSERMALLARHLAPVSGVRLERLSLTQDHQPATTACRRIIIPDMGSVLLTITRAQLDQAAEAITAPALSLADADAESEPDLADADHTTAQIEPVRQEVQQTLLPSRAVRFVWEMDAATRFTLISDEFAQVLCTRNAVNMVLGRTWSQLSEHDIDDVDRRVSVALSARRTWSKLNVFWHEPDRAEPVQIALSAVPVYDAMRQFTGYRGFGVAHAVTSTQAQNSPDPCISPVVLQPVELQPVELQPVELQPVELQPVELNDVPIEGLQDFVSAPAGMQPVPQLPVKDIVVQLHPRTKGDVSRNDTGGEGFVPRPVLSPNERSAFRDIARALGARMADDKPLVEENAFAKLDASDDHVAQDKPAIDLSDVITTLPPARRNDGFAELLDKLPIGVLVSRGEEIAYANQTLLSLLDYDDFAQLAALNSVGRLFNEAAPVEGSRPIQLIRRGGETTEVDARLSAITWNDTPATLMAFRRA